MTYKLRFLKNKNNTEAIIRAIKTIKIGKMIEAKIDENAPPPILLLGMYSSQWFPSKFSMHWHIIFDESNSLTTHEPPFLHGHLYGWALACSNAALQIPFKLSDEVVPSGQAHL